MKKIFFIILFFISAKNCFAQQITFQKTYGGTGDDWGFAVQQTTDSGYIITGTTNSFGAGDYDVYLIKTDANGDSLWSKTFGGISFDEGNSVQQTTDGGYIIIGFTNSFGAGYYDVYLIKTDANGDSLWTKTYGGTGDDKAYSVQQTADGGYIIAGVTTGFGNSYVYLIKTDSNGNSVWAKGFDGYSTNFGTSIQQTTDGGYIITGSTLNFVGGDREVYLIKTDSIGNMDWTKIFGGTTDEVGYSVQQTIDGGYIIAGFSQTFGAGINDVYLIKTDANGDSLWTKTFGGTSYDGGTSVQQTNDGGYIITGWTRSFSSNNKAYLIKTDANGSLLWSKIFGGINSNDGRSVQQTIDGGHIITGITSSFGAGNWDVYLIKTDSLGNSGCNQSSPASIVTSPPTQVTSPATIVASPATVVTTPATIVGIGGTVTTLCTTVGIPFAILNLQSTITISPNPTTNNFTITFPNTINKGSIEIYNVLGKKIFNENIFNSYKKEIHLKNIEAGIYFVKVKDGEKEFCKKLVIE